MEDKQPTPVAPNDAPASSRRALTNRERQILGLLASGMSGAQIAAQLVLSPETVRTHVRNAMGKLGASTRSQAVAVALQSHEIAGEAPEESAERVAVPPAPAPPADATAALAEMVTGLVELFDVNAGAVYLAEEDGLSLARVTEGTNAALPGKVALGDGPLGRTALDRRVQMLHDPVSGSSQGSLLAAPIVGAGRLIGVIALVARESRPVGRSELLLLRAFANRVGELLASNNGVDRGLARAMERFRTSWAAATRVS